LVLVDKDCLKKVYNDGFFTLDSYEWELLYNSLTSYKDSKLNDIANQRIEGLRGKILMLYGKDNPKLICRNKKLKNFMKEIFK
jgi:hypothetical protein